MERGQEGLSMGTGVLGKEEATVQAYHPVPVQEWVPAVRQRHPRAMPLLHSWAHTGTRMAGGLTQGPTGAVSAGSGFLKSRMEREALLSGGGDLARQGQGHGGQAPVSSGDLPLACNTQQVCHRDWKNLKFNRGISSMNKSSKQRQKH